jgi:hypothetical protein
MSRSSARLRAALPVLAVVVAVLVPVVAGTDAAEVVGRPVAATSLRTTAHTFVSLVPACCARHSDLDVFSLRTGRRLQRLVRLPSYGGAELGTPAADAHRQLFLTLTSGPRCAVTGYMECPRWVPNSCANSVLSFKPGHGSLVTAFRIPGSETLGYAVPSPDGLRLALTLSPCISQKGTSGLFARERSGRVTRPIFRTNNTCDQFGRPAWNAAGTKLAFVFDRALGPPQQVVAGGACAVGVRQRLAIASSGHASTLGRLTLIAPNRGCLFGADAADAGVAFDRGGVAVAEGCKRGSPRGSSDVTLGYAYLLQFSAGGKLIQRVRLGRGLSDAFVATIPRTGNVLVTLDQGANEPWPYFDWVSEFDGTKLRPIARYKAIDSPQVLAVPW